VKKPDDRGGKNTPTRSGRGAKGCGKRCVVEIVLDDAARAAGENRSLKGWLMVAECW